MTWYYIQHGALGSCLIIYFVKILLVMAYNISLGRDSTWEKNLLVGDVFSLVTHHDIHLPSLLPMDDL